MSRYYPHPEYAEDQPLAYTILTVHVATRAVTVGSIIGIGSASVRQLIPSLRSASTAPFATRLLTASAKGSIWALAITGLGLAGRMYGREMIEWQDRSWRLLENKGQVETDDWTYGGMGVATAAALISMARSKGGARPAVAMIGWKGVFGAAGLGSVGGMLGYMGWRYGVNGGKFPEKPSKKAERISL